MFLFLILLLIVLSGCPFSPKSSIKSTFEIVYIDSYFLINYNLVVLKSERGEDYILISPKQCDLDSTEMMNYRKININKSFDINIIKYNKYPELESSFRVPEIQIDYSEDDSQENGLIWSWGKFNRKVYYSPEICGLFLLKQ